MCYYVLTKVCEAFMNIQDLEAKFKNNSENYPDSLRLKLHRAISWLKSAEEHSDDLDFCFVSLWIAINAIYSDDFNVLGDKSNLFSFLNKVCRLDSELRINALVWQTFSNNIRVLLNNKFTFQPFWDEYNTYEKDKITEKWKDDFEYEKKRFTKAISKQNTAELLCIVFRRLYTIRNQIIHGGASYKSSKNIPQKKDACNFLIKVMPVIVDIMMDNPTQNWGKPYYPVVV